VQGLILDWEGVVGESFFTKYATITWDLFSLNGLNTSYEEFSTFMKQQEKNYQKGIVSSKQFWNSVINDLLLDSSKIRISDLEQLFLDSFKVTDKNLNLVREVRKLVPTVLLSNNYREQKAQIEPLNLFDKAFYSCDSGLLKPNPEFFRLAINYHKQINPKITDEEILYVDDKQKHVDAALSLGIKAEICSSPTKLREILAEYFPII